MKITGVEIYQYLLNLRQPFVSHGQPFDRREGLLVRLTLSDGHCGVGEVAPLPGVSRENLKKALFQLKELRSFLLSTDVPDDLMRLRTMFGQSPFDSLCPSVAFGVQAALIQLGVVNNLHPISIFQGVGKDISVAGLLQGTPDEIAAQARALLHLKCRTFKLKVGDRNIPLDVKRFYSLYDLLGKEHRIRLDANQSWHAHEAMAFCKNVTRDKVEFIEEPVKGPQDLDAFVTETGFDAAMDETLWDVNRAAGISKNVRFLVIKPMMVGLFKSLDWIEYATKSGRQCVISSSFESGVGARLLAQLATLTTTDAGLGTGDWLGNDLLRPLREQAHYVVRWKETIFEWSDIDQSLLFPVKF